MNTLANSYKNEFTRLLKIESPIICGAMYPCSNPDLVAAASEAGGIGIVQPISLTYVYGYNYRAGLQYIRSLTDKPIGVNMLVEGSSGTYRKRLEEWMEISLEEGRPVLRDGTWKSAVGRRQGKPGGRHCFS